MKSKVHQAIYSMPERLKALYYNGDASHNLFEKWYPEQSKENESILKQFNLTIEQVDSYGGEDMGSDYWRIFKFTDKESGESVLVKFDGSYASYSGSTFESWFFVDPKQVMVTQYVKCDV